MARNMRNWRVLLAIALTAGMTSLWQNCSEVQFGSEPLGLNTKIGDEDLVTVDPLPCGEGEDCDPVPPPPRDDNPPPPPPCAEGEDCDPVIPPPPTPECEHGKSCDNNPKPPVIDDGGEGACNIEVADIIIDLSFAKAQGADSATPFQSVTGTIGLKAMVSSGLVLKALADSKSAVSTVDLALNRGEGNYILDTDGNRHALDTLASQGKPGIKIRTGAALELQADGTYRLKLLAFPSLKKHGNDGCRLENNLKGSLVAE